jgi:hypothetical protein
MASHVLGLVTLGTTSLVLTVTGGAPSTARYRIDQTLTQEIDGTASGKGKQSLSFSTSGFVSLTLTDSTNGRVVKLVVDSIKGDSTSPIPPAVFDSARGAEYHAFLSKAGKLSELEAITTTAAAMQVQGFLSDFFPWVKSGVKVGEKWADTSSRSTVSGEDTVVVKSVTSYQAQAKDKRGNEKAIRITSDYASTVAGRQPTPSGSASLEGSSKGTGTYFVTSDGRYLGGDREVHSTLSITGSFADKPVPVTVTQTTKVTALQ